MSDLTDAFDYGPKGIRVEMLSWETGLCTRPL